MFHRLNFLTLKYQSENFNKVKTSLNLELNLVIDIILYLIFKINIINFKIF